MGNIFSEVAKFFHLGLGIDRDGAFAIQYISEKLEKTVRRTYVLARSGLKLGGLSADAAMSIFTSNVRSLVTYAIGLCPLGSNRINNLNRVQIDFGNDFLGLPREAGWVVAFGELGIIDLSLVAARARIMLLHRVHNNKEDPLTKSMVNWPTSLGGESFADECSQSLRTLGYNAPIRTILTAHYPSASICLKKLMQSTQRDLWSAAAPSISGAYKNAKLEWGLEPALTLCPTNQARDLILLRSGMHPPHSDTPPGSFTLVCTLCGGPRPGVPHLLCECPAINSARLQFSQYMSAPCPDLLYNIQHCPLSWPPAS